MCLDSTPSCIETLHTISLQSGRHEPAHFLRLPISFFYYGTLIVFFRGLETALLLDEPVTRFVVLGLYLAVHDGRIKLIGGLWLR